MPRPDRPLDLDQHQPPVRPRADGVGDLSEEERHARLLAALRALLQLPASRSDGAAGPRTRDQEPEG